MAASLGIIKDMSYGGSDRSKKRLSWVALPIALVVCGLAVSCAPISQHPLSSPEKSSIDKDLIGAWGWSEGGNFLLVHVTPAPEDNCPGCMKAVVAGKPDGGKFSVYHAEFFSSNINGEYFLNVPMRMNFDVLGAPIPGKIEEGYTFIHYYILDDGKVLWRWLDLPKLVATVELGELGGEFCLVTDDNMEFTRLTESTANLRKFFGGHSHEQVFSNDTYTLIKDYPKAAD